MAKRLTRCQIASMRGLLAAPYFVEVLCGRGYDLPAWWPSENSIAKLYGKKLIDKYNRAVEWRQKQFMQGCP